MNHHKHLALIIASLSAAGGAERVLCGLANHWANQGHYISMITTEALKGPPFYPLDPRVTIIRINKKKGGLRLSFSCIQNLFECFFRLRRTLKELNPDLIISFIDLTNIATLLATYGLKIPVIVSERIDPAYRKLPCLFQWLRLALYPRAQQLIVQTASIAAYFPKRFSLFISVIPNAVQKPDCIKMHYASKPKKIVTVGRLDAQKDHQTLILAFKALLTHDPELTLTIYGEGKERHTLQKLIKTLDLEQAVQLAGLSTKLPDILVDADLFMFSSRYEGIPNALCEAMALGLPVIVSNCSGNTEIVQDRVNGRLFPVGDVASLTEIARECLSDPDQCQRLGTEARHLSERFSPPSIFTLWDQQLKSAFAQRA